MPKTYFLAPTRDSPPDGPISLGSIISSPRSPEISINGKTSAVFQALRVHESVSTASTLQLNSGGKGSVGIWTEFLGGILGVQGKVSTCWDNSKTTTFAFKELITRQIFPEVEDIRRLFEEPAVQRAIKDSRFKANLYMIVSVKIARGADVAISKAAQKGGKLFFGVDTTAAGVPIQVGPDISLSTAKGQSLTDHYTTDFVFAYRLRELVYRRKAVVKQREVKGNLYGIGRNSPELKTKKAELEGGVEAGGILQDDLTAEDCEYDIDPVVVVDDDGEEVECIVLGDGLDDGHF